MNRVIRATAYLVCVLLNTDLLAEEFKSVSLRYKVFIFTGLHGVSIKGDEGTSGVTAKSGNALLEFSKAKPIVEFSKPGYVTRIIQITIPSSKLTDNAPIIRVPLQVNAANGIILPKMESMEAMRFFKSRPLFENQLSLERKRFSEIAKHNQQILNAAPEQPKPSVIIPAAVEKYPDTENLLTSNKWRYVLSEGVKSREDLVTVYDTHTNYYTDSYGRSQSVTTVSTRYEKRVLPGSPSFIAVYAFNTDYTFTDTWYSDDKVQKQISGIWRCLGKDKVLLTSNAYTEKAKSGIEITVTQNELINGPLKYLKVKY